MIKKAKNNYKLAVEIITSNLKYERTVTDVWGIYS